MIFSPNPNTVHFGPTLKNVPKSKSTTKTDITEGRVILSATFLGVCLEVTEPSLSQKQNKTLCAFYRFHRMFNPF